MFSKFAIRFDTAEYMRHWYARWRVNRIALSESKRLPRKCAVDYYQLVHKNIMSQRYAGSYPAYHPRYLKWKKQIAPSLDFWRLHDALVSNLRAFRVYGGLPGEVAYMGGIDDSVSYKGKSIAMYGKAVEEGKFGKGTATKPRPVFWPTGLEYSQGPMRSRQYQSLAKIKSAWR